MIFKICFEKITTTTLSLPKSKVLHDTSFTFHIILAFRKESKE